jgi:glycosyltransferase involved in cell wall biosynthesis
MYKVIHLLPYDGIGGAEAAARSMRDLHHEAIDFRLRFLFPNVRNGTSRIGTFNPFAYLSSIRRVIKDEPELLIVSLWRACAAGILVKLFRPSTRLVVLIHNSVDAHTLDYLFTRWAMALSHAIWSDSAASIRMRFARQPKTAVTVIPFLTQHLSPARDIEEALQPNPTFIFWGRLAAQKNLGKAISIFHQIWHSHRDARFTVIGPDSGELDGLKAECAAKGIGSVVHFAGALTFDAICKQAQDHSFYLQTSNYEGMAMSVVESMQLGLVPIVSPVGEVGSYCNDQYNSILVDEVEQAVTDITHLLNDAAAFATLRRNAILTWQGKPLYRDAMITESLRLLGTNVDGQKTNMSGNGRH